MEERINRLKQRIERMTLNLARYTGKWQSTCQKLGLRLNYEKRNKIL